MNWRLLMVGLAFIAGILASNVFVQAGFSTPVYNGGFEFPASTGILTEQTLEMPQDRISEDQIIVRSDRVVLDIKGAQWATFTPTKSMVPFIDSGANAIQVEPESDCKDVEVGDVISYRSEYADGIIIHRVIEKGQDNQGAYFVAKGDNNPTADPGRIRCEHIERVLVAVIY